MTNHTARHRKGTRSSAALLLPVLKAARGLLQDIGAIAGILSALGCLPPAPAIPSTGDVTSAATVYGMSDRDGLEEFGELARWRDVLLRFPGGRTEPYRVVAIDGRLPSKFQRPLNDARTVYERFELLGRDSDVAVYEWRDIEESWH